MPCVRAASGLVRCHALCVVSARITISLPDPLAALVAREAKRRGETVSAFVREAVESYLRAGPER